MHDPMILPEEHCRWLTEATNRSLHTLYTILAINMRPPHISVDDTRSMMASTGAYSDYH